MRTLAFHRYVAEFIATFILALGVSVSLVTDLPLATPVIAGLTVGIFVYTIGGVSGAHINPAVTVGLASIGKIDALEAVRYVIAQLLGGIAAMGIVAATLEVPDLLTETSLTVVLGEALGAFLLVFGVCAVVHERVPAAAAGLVIGGSLLVGILVASGFSNGILNPAVALAVNSLSVFYAAAPLIGGILGAWVYRWLLAH